MATDDAQTKQEKREKAQANRQMMHLVTNILSQRETTTEQLLEDYPGKRARLERELRLARSCGLTMGRRNKHMATVKGRKVVLVSWIGRHGAATTQNMIDRFKFDRNVIEMSIREAFDERLLALTGTLRREDELWVATRAGMNSAWLTHMRECPVSQRQEGHLRACVAQAILLELEYGPSYRVLSEREISALNGRGKKGNDRVASPEYYYKEAKSKTPDLLVVREGPKGEFIEVIAIEVELTVKNDREGRAILGAYRRFTGIDVVHYLAAPNVVRPLKAMQTKVDEQIAALIEAGKLDVVNTRPVTITTLRSSEVPALRRLKYYEPITIKGADERFQAIQAAPSYPKVENELLDLLEWVGGNGVVSIDAVAKRFALDDEDPEAANQLAYELLLSAHGAGWLHCTEMLYNEDRIFFATAEGLETVNLDPDLYLVNYKNPAHYGLAGALCRRSRVGAELYRETKLARWSVVSQWASRGDAIFNRTGVLNISEGKLRSVGEHKSPDLTLVNNVQRAAPTRVVLIYPFPLQIDKLRFAVEEYIAHPNIGHIYLYIGDQKVLEGAKRAVEKLKVAQVVTVRALPISDTERALRARRRA